MQSKTNSRFSSLWGWLQHNRSEIFPVTFLVLLCTSVLLTNPLGPTQWLIGWDNINPEFSLLLNIKRAIFSVWQEYQGMGLLAGMGHAADLPRLLVLGAVSLIIPTNYLRYGWVMLMLLMGTIGTYALIRHIIPSRLAAMAGSLYLFVSFATRQTFYTPFEPFVAHFGFLPWLILAILRIFEHPTKKRILWFAILSIFATPQAYVQTVFISYLLVVAAISIGRPLKRVAIIWFTIFCINAFWLLPTIYFWKTGSQVTVNAKINQMATDESYLRNKAFGTLTNTIQLKGFWFDTFDFDPQRTELTPILGYWRAFADSPLVTSVVFGLFGIVLLGVWTVLRAKRHYWLIGVWLAGITLLTIQTPPFSWINDALNSVPLFHQAFRLRFTKFNTMTGLSYSLLFGIGFAAVSLWLAKIPKWLREVAAFLVLSAFILLSYPVWQGQFFYQGIKLTIPADYTQLFQYFSNQPDKSRIMNLPQHMYWGWTYYKFGYIGWGFPWYGIEQPIADRAFDVWSATNENYFWELSRALYSKDSVAIEKIIDKYDIHYILLDENISTPNNFRTLFTDETKELFAQMPGVREAATFGKITVYQRTGETTKNFVSVQSNLPTVNAYKWNDNDVAYAELGDYITKQQIDENDNTTIIYPYRSLFTKRSVSEREFDVNTIIPKATLVYDSAKSADLVAGNVKKCGLLRTGTAGATMTDSTLRLESSNQRGCLSFDIPALTHKEGYLVAVESRHVSGRPLMISFINDTARHVELETYLPETPEATTSSFILPPLAADGLGYTVYISNDAIGRQPSINDLRSIRIYQIPYEELVHEKARTQIPASAGMTPMVSHPNPAFYKVSGASAGTLILSQSYDSGWIALQNGKLLTRHVLVNNWANGWEINPGTTSTIYILFWPQLLEFLGFALLPIPFLWALFVRKSDI
ncbi:MAG: hypothetical protein UY49_C0002G0004 [Microgenomates group bacterium GW2011_GWC1_49_7]|nr:MAG: hypothetical protein UY49_C0002G0004 [Microgenomates group bacterium GW2011_GWC1_49_7]